MAEAWRCGSGGAAKAKLDAMSTNQLKLDWLREQIEMRVIGLGFEEFKPAWSSSKDENMIFSSCCATS